MAKHQQHYYEEDPFRESWTLNHFVLPHYIHNAMDTYVSLGYKCHRDLATSIKLWGDANLDKVFWFQQEIIASTSTKLKFSIEIQVPSQRKLMVNLDHQKAIACDAKFETNDKKVLWDLYHILPPYTCNVFKGHINNKCFVSCNSHCIHWWFSTNGKMEF